MLRLYCLPGRVIAEIGFLFPGTGQIWASARRRESRVAHFLFATMFWLAIAFGVFVYLNPLHKHSDRNVTQTTEVGDAPGSSQPDEAISEPASLDTPGEDHQEADQTPSPDLGRSDLKDEEQQAIDPFSEPKVQAAIAKAVRNGEPVRWKAAGLKGYAVPSDPSANGCRSVRVSVDGRSLDEFPSTNVCPELAR